MKATDAANIADNVYFLCLIMYHDKDTISVLPHKGDTQKTINAHTQIENV